MPATKLESLLSKHAFLEDIQPHHLTLLLDCAQLVRIFERQLVFEEGQQADRCYLMVSGSVTLEASTPHRKAIPIETIGPGEVLGTSWLLPEGRWRFAARASEPTETIALEGPKLLRLMREDHELGYQLHMRLIRTVFKRLEATRFRLVDLYDQRYETEARP